MLRPTLCLAILCTAVRIAAAETTPPDSALARIFTPEEFKRAGLGKLSASELAALEASLLRHQQLPATAKTVAERETPTSAPAGAVSPAPKPPVVPAKSASGFGAEQVSATKPADLTEELHSRIEGTLDGFSGRAVFALENGQVWQLRSPETASFSRKLVNPEVIISRGPFGYKMIIVPADRIVPVKRIQ